MSHVKAHVRRTAKGQMQLVHDYDDHRSRQPANPRPKHVVRIADPGAVKMRETVTELLRTPKGMDEFEAKVKAGGFQKTLPEVVYLYGVEQGSHHPYRDAFDHTMQVLRHLPADATDNERWGALLHDIGKGTTQRFSQKRNDIVFDNHEEVGYRMAKKVLARLGFDKADRDDILHMVRYHGSLRTAFLRDRITEDEQIAFMQHPSFDSLFRLHEADVAASGRDPSEVKDRIRELRKKIKEKA